MRAVSGSHDSISSRCDVAEEHQRVALRDDPDVAHLAALRRDRDVRFNGVVRPVGRSDERRGIRLNIVLSGGFLQDLLAVERDDCSLPAMALTHPGGTAPSAYESKVSFQGSGGTTRALRFAGDPANGRFDQSGLLDRVAGDGERCRRPPSPSVLRATRSPLSSRRKRPCASNSRARNFTVCPGFTTSSVGNYLHPRRRALARLDRRRPRRIPVSDVAGLRSDRVHRVARYEEDAPARDGSARQNRLRRTFRCRSNCSCSPAARLRSGFRRGRHAVAG